MGRPSSPLAGARDDRPGTVACRGCCRRGAGLVLRAQRQERDIHDFGDAAFFSTVQLLTVSSQIKNPLTTGGRVVDVFLEIWALFVVTTIAGSFAAFFGAGDA
jgi:hypothetical protein